MTISLEEMLAELPADRRDRIEKRASKLIAEEINLRELRRLRKLTQARLSKKLKIGQEGVSRIEKRTDLYLSTLRSFVEAVGGTLSLIVEFPDNSAVTLAGFGENSSPRNNKNGAQKMPKEPSRSKPKTRRAA
jgi:DNA-binding XRE family transcriptional regulator